MPAPRTPLPAALRSRPFTVAEAYAAGTTRSQLRHPSLRTPFHGVRIPPGVPDDLRTRCVAASLILPPGSAIDGAAAAVLHGLPVPAAVDPSDGSVPIEVRVPPGATPPRISGLTARTGPTGRPVPPGRLLLAAPATAWATLGPRLGIDDLVVLGDAVARTPGGLRALRAHVVPGRRLPGRARLGEALELVRERVDSPQETRTRLLLVRSGVPEPEVNRDAFDAGGGWLGQIDLGWHDVKVALEYLGDVHRTAKGRWRKDVARREVLEDNGWRVLFVTADDLSYRRLILVRRVSDALRERGLAW